MFDQYIASINNTTISCFFFFFFFILHNSYYPPAYMSSLNALNQSPVPKMQHVDAKLCAQDMCPVVSLLQ